MLAALSLSCCASPSRSVAPVSAASATEQRCGHGVQPLRMVYGACKYLSYGNYQDADSKLRFYTTVATVSPAP